MGTEEEEKHVPDEGHDVGSSQNNNNNNNNDKAAGPVHKVRALASLLISPFL